MPTFQEGPSEKQFGEDVRVVWNVFSLQQMAVGKNGLCILMFEQCSQEWLDSWGCLVQSQELDFDNPCGYLSTQGIL